MKNNKNLCETCPDDLRGKCCHDEVKIKELRLVSDTTCCFLNKKTKKCRIYFFRKLFTLGACASIPFAIQKGLLPKRCPCVINDSNYQQRDDVKLYDFEIREITRENRGDEFNE